MRYPTSAGCLKDGVFPIYWKRVKKLLFLLVIVVLNAPWFSSLQFASAQAISGPEEGNSELDRGDQALASAFVGKWTYRSFRSTPGLSDPAAPLSALLFGQGTMEFNPPVGENISGTLGGEGWQLTLSGTVTGTSPTTVRVQGKGMIGGEEWIYDYLGYMVPAWPNGVEQRPAIIGSIIRTVPHSNGTATAGYVAQWIAVKQDTEVSERAAIQGHSQSAARGEGAYRRNLLELYLEDAKRELLEQQSAPKEKPTNKQNSMQPNDAQRQIAPQSRVLAQSGGRVDVELVVDYATHRIGNDNIRVRSYNGALVGPTIRAKAGDTLFITLRNKLPSEPAGTHPVNSHHEWNTTNLHFHGLHVAPQGPPGKPDEESDNVLLELKPTADPAGSVQKYAVHIPADHVAGTFWYHAHKHGSVAGQVASGMAGALIIEREDELHNLDSVPEVAAACEEIMLLQQIPYLKIVGAAVGSIERSADGSGSNELAMLAPQAWRNLRRYVTVNGTRIPTLHIAPGEVRRIRFIHTGQREEINLRIERATGTIGTGPDTWAFNEIAADGLPTGDIRARDTLSLFPGYRSDVLVQPPSDASGEFHLIDTKAPPGVSADGSPEPLKLIARLIVSGAKRNMTLPTPEALRPHRLPDIDPLAVTKTQHAYYGIVPVPGGGVEFYISQENLVSGQVPTGKPFSHTAIRPLCLGSTERWVVGTRNGGGITATHPFHIHINPFLVTEVRNASNDDVTVEEFGGSIWRDTLAMKQGYTYKFLTRYDDFTGDFVNHCHILDHEDNGMMELVSVVDPCSTTPLTRAMAAPSSSQARSFNVATTIPEPVGKPQILFFVQGSFCPHCMSQLVEMATVLAGKDCDVFVVSATSEADLQGFPDVPFTLVADPQQLLFNQYGVIEGGEPRHGTIVRDGSGRELLRKIGDEPFMDSKAILDSLPVSGPRIVVAVRNTDSVVDDYVTWAPTVCQIRIEDGDISKPDLVVALRNDDASLNPSGGDLRFAESVTPGQTATNEFISVSLPQSGSPKTFYIAGIKAGKLTPQSLLDGGRDAVIEVRENDITGSRLTSHSVMVRVRKDASTLNALERAEFLDAIATVKGGGMYDRLVDLHTIATGRSSGANWRDQAHREAAFIPWHRAFLLQYERELQKSHPHISLHYWREDVASNVFVTDFLGANTVISGSPLVDVNFGSLADGNPLLGWKVDGVSLFRGATNRSDVSWCRPQSSVISPTDYRSPTSNFSRGLENNPHNDGHGWVGGWMSSCQTSPRDPIFFLFHCDIDRLWAKWQWNHGRFGVDGNDPKNYFPNDDYVTGSATPLGHHLLDTMWPWDEVTGLGVPSDFNDNRPSTSPESPFPASTIPGVWPAAPGKPMVSTMIDYLGVGANNIDLGFCYDDIGFGAKPSNVNDIEQSGVRERVAIVADAEKPFVERMRAAGGLVGQIPKNEVQNVIAVLRDPAESDAMRTASLRAVAGSSDPLWIRAAIDVLESAQGSSDQLRHEIVNQIGTVAMFTDEGHHAAKEIRTALRTLIDEKENAELRLAAATALATEADGETIEMLRNVIKQDGDTILQRKDAVRLLAIAVPGQNHDALRQLIVADEDTEVRIAALLSLGNDRASIEQRRAITLDAKESIAVREAAMRTLMQHDMEFPSVAMRLLSDTTESVEMRKAAIVAIQLFVTYNSQILDVETIEMIRSRLEEYPTDVRGLRDSIDSVNEKLGRIESRKRK